MRHKVRDTKGWLILFEETDKVQLQFEGRSLVDYWYIRQRVGVNVVGLCLPTIIMTTFKGPAMPVDKGYW